jgi:nucleotide-binding universal stress UspA family protein
MSSEPIVTGTDGSPTAERAVDRAAELAQALDASLHVVSVLEVASVPGSAEKVVADSRDRLEARGIKVQTHVRTGDAASELIKVAEAEHAQMIVLGNRGMTGPGRVLGSVPNTVSHYAQCDVLITPTAGGRKEPAASEG